MSGGLRAGAWYLCFTCKSCSRPFPFAESAPGVEVPPSGRARVVTTRCPYPDCTARHDYLTSDLVRLQAEPPPSN